MNINELRKRAVNLYATEAEALAAVKQDGYALQFVYDQTEAICMAAVKKNGYALRYVHNQTEAICMAAVNQYPGAIKHVNPAVLSQAAECDGKVVEIEGQKYRMTAID